MRYAILDEDNIVTALVEADNPPPNSVKGHDESAAVGRFWNGWTFEDPQ
jgi:hypothetical protein